MAVSPRLSSAAREPRSGAVRLAGRLLVLYAGLVLYGGSSALIVRSGLGVEPWNVLHQGIARHTGLSIGAVSVIVGAAVLLLWIPLRQRPGLGTVSNVFVVGVVLDAVLDVVPAGQGLPARIGLLACGVVLNGAATGLYIAAGFGPGPRDGLMTGLHRATGRPLALVRVAIELSVLVAGFALGGTVGLGTVLFALCIGPTVQFAVRLLGRVPSMEL
jgi:uncharacterized membrane protein YczE